MRVAVPYPVCYKTPVMPAAGIELIRHMAVGDRAAFSEFYNTYAALAYRLIVRIVGDRDDAADVLQEVFWHAWESASTYDPARGSPEAWIITRARSRAIDRVRSVRRRSATFVGPADDAVAAPPGKPHEGAAQAADHVWVEKALEALSVEQREVVRLAYFAGLTQSEIARRLEQPLGTVKTRMRRALERLRGIMGSPDV